MTRPITQYQQSPSFLAMYHLAAPLDTSLCMDEQVEILFHRSSLEEYNSGGLRDVGVLSQAGNIRGKSLAEIYQAVSRSSSKQMIQHVEDCLKQFIESGYHLEDVPLLWDSHGEMVHLRVSYYGFLENGELSRFLIIYRDDSASYYQEELVNNLAQSLAAESGESFFSNLVFHLARTLDVDYAMLAEKLPNSDYEGRVLAFHQRSNVADLQGSVISLRDQPGSAVFEGQVCVFSEGLQKLAADEPLIEMYGVDSYIAVPVFGEGSQVLGFLSLMHSKPIINVELVRSVLQIFSIRVSAEIERRRIAELGRRRRLQQQVFIDNSSHGMFVVNIDPPMPLDIPVHRQVQWLADHSKFSDANPAFLKIFKIPDLELLVGKSLYSQRLEFDFATTMRNFVGENCQVSEQIIRFVVEGEHLWISANASGVIVDGKLVQVLGMMTDITERVSDIHSMEERARHDGLTGLPNRNYFISQVEQSMKLSAPGRKHALLLLDLDGFKEINDTLGHEMGDFLLKQIGPRFEQVPGADRFLLARAGGDEFAVFIENYENLEQIAEVAETLIQAVKAPFAVNELELVIGGSIGVALYPEHAESVSSLMRCADVAMYQSKQESVDYRFYSTEQDHFTVRRLSLMMDIRQAIDNSELRLFYQPIISLKDQAPVSFEGLIRWQHPQHGLLSPGEFIPLIEITDMIVPVTWWVIETAVKQLADWQKQGLSYRISVNVSAHNLIDAGFVSFIEGCLRRYEVDGSALEIEITESTLMSDPEKARALLQSIASLGCTISIDDYGTGYSSLAYLKSLPINTLKIDRAFISQMLCDTQDQIIVNSTVQLAHNLGLNVTAEGIEELSLVDALVNLGCDKGQGFYFCRPLPIEELNYWLSEFSKAPAAAKH